jgi:hypothetical protein
MTIFKRKLNKSGLSLVEVLVSAAMTAVVSLGVATMMQNSFKEQRRIVLLDTLKNQKTRFETMFRDQTIFNKTIQYNAVTAVAAPFTTIYASMNGSASNTTEISYSSPVEFRVAFADGTLAYDLLGPADATGPYNGFTEKGAYRTNCFRADSSGNDDCPISYRLLISADCPSGSSCANPQLKLVARLVFNPSTTGVLRSYASFINAVAGIDISDSVQDSKYDAVVKRTATGVNRSFRLAIEYTPSSGCSSQGGTCSNISSFTVGTTSGLHPRAVSPSWTVKFDPYSLVSSVGQSFQLKESGYYGCIMSSPAFATDAFTLALAKVNDLHQYQSSISENKITIGKWSQGTAVIDAKFSINNPVTDRFTVYQRCSIPSGNSWDGCTLGWSTDYDKTIELVSLNCYKIDRAM